MSYQWKLCSKVIDIKRQSKLGDEYPHSLGSDEVGRVGKGRGDRRGNYSGRGQGLHGGMLLKLPFSHTVDLFLHCFTLSAG